MRIKSNIPLKFGERNQDDFSLSYSTPSPDEIWFFPDHWHDCFEIIWVQEGREKVTICGCPLEVSAGEIVVIPPHILHSTHEITAREDISAEETAERQYFKSLTFGYTEALIYTSDLSFSNLKYLLPFRYLKLPEQYLLTGDSEHLKRLRELLTAIDSYYNSVSPTRELLIRSYILELHSILYTCLLWNNPTTSLTREQNNYLLEAQLYIESHLREDISPYVIADHLHISYGHLTRLCKQMLGVPLTGLICRMRLNLAEQLLVEQPEISVTECASATGFDNVSYFIKLFRREKGYTPNQFREMLRRDGV